MTSSEGFVRVPGPVLRVLGTDTSCVGDWTLSKPSTLPIMFRAGVPCCVCSQEALPSQSNGGCALPFAAVELPRLESQHAVVASQGPALTRSQGSELTSSWEATEMQR